jgi:hypothetical protein
MSVNSNKLWKQFQDAADQIAEDLSVPKGSVAKERQDYPYEEFELSASGYKVELPAFEFRLDCRHDGKVQRLRCALEITYAKNVPVYFIEDDVTEKTTFENFIVRWGAWAIYQYFTTKNPVNLETMVGQPAIRVYGLPEFEEPTLTEAQLLLSGIKKCGWDVRVIRFRHVDQGNWYRWISYAFSIQGVYQHIWIFFCKCAGLDSGGAYGQFCLFEDLIKKLGSHAKYEKYDIDYLTLVRFLLKYQTGLHAIMRDYELERSHSIWLNQHLSALGTTIYDAYVKVTTSFEKEEYAGALRDMRALVQDAEKQVAKSHAISVDEDHDDVTNLAGKLIGGKVIDGRLQSWFQAFASIANLASHGLFPTAQDWTSDETRMQVLTTFAIGKQLLVELVRGKKT